ncbi:MAG: alpha/beta fold hydrolase [Trebonia sp.]
MRRSPRAAAVAPAASSYCSHRVRRRGQPIARDTRFRRFVDDARLTIGGDQSSRGSGRAGRECGVVTLQLALPMVASGQRLAARHGELVRSLTLLDTSADAEEPARVRERRQLALFHLLFGVRPILGRVKPLLFGPGFLADPGSDELISEWLRRLGETRRSAVRKAVLGVAERAPVAAELGGITAPTLVVVGADDRATPPEHARRIADGIPGARLRIVPDCGHSSTLEQPGVLSDLLTEFLSKVDQADSRARAAAAKP